MTALMAIDPGGEHVGWARFDRLARDARVNAGEVTPARILAQVFELVRHHPDTVLVIEEWRLYPQTARTQIGSDMPTSQLIGALRYIARAYGVEPVMQPADMRKVGTAWVREHRSGWAGTGDHAHDAESHGWAYLLRHAPTANDVVD